MGGGARARCRRPPGAFQPYAAGAHGRKTARARESGRTRDRDAEVYADAEGTGSQGRPFSEPESETEEETGPPSTPGITADKEGRVRVDLEA